MIPNDYPMKVVVVFGTRPEAIKLAPVISELDRQSQEGKVSYATCVTAQHRQMLDQVLEVFNIHPDYDLDLMSEGQTPAQVAAAVLSSIEPVLVAESPDYVIVQGDTTTVAAASLASHYAGIRVAHVEAGLRSNDKWQPFPEETNRKVASVIADIHFAPTALARSNLLGEGVNEQSIVVTGNTVIDALRIIASRDRPAEIGNLIDSMTWLSEDRLLLVTAHRRENFGEPMANICSAIKILTHEHRNLKVVFPVHMNPDVRQPVTEMLSGNDNIILIDPLDYTSLVHLMASAHVILTDSGGIQEEAPALGKPVLIMREVTERPEGIEAGVARLVGAKSRSIINAVQLLLEDKREYDKMSKAVNPYGDGKASPRIVRTLLSEPTDEFSPSGQHDSTRS